MAKTSADSYLFYTKISGYTHIYCYSLAQKNDGDFTQ